MPADLCHMAVLGAGSSFEPRRPGSCFPKKKEIMCMCTCKQQREFLSNAYMHQ